MATPSLWLALERRCPWPAEGVATAIERKMNKNIVLLPERLCYGFTEFSTCLDWQVYRCHFKNGIGPGRGVHCRTHVGLPMHLLGAHRPHKGSLCRAIIFQAGTRGVLDSKTRQILRKGFLGWTCITETEALTAYHSTGYSRLTLCRLPE